MPQDNLKTIFLPNFQDDCINFVSDACMLPLFFSVLRFLSTALLKDFFGILIAT